MKKRIYRIIASTLTVFFLFLFILNNYYPYISGLNTFTTSLIIILAIVSLSFLARKAIVKVAIKPLNSFTEYVANKVLEKDVPRSVEDRQKLEVYELLRNYGYSADEIKLAMKKLSEKTELRKDFTANVSHELKSPLTSINGYAELIATGMVQDDQVEVFAGRILKEGNRLLELIDQTIQLAKMDSNQIKTESFINFDLGELISEVLDSVDHPAGKKDISIKYDYKKIDFYGHERLIYDLIRNLVSNAIKYSSDENPKLEIDTYIKEDEIYLVFKDNGIGISKEDQERIFERFYVADKSRGNKTGTGLGLSIVKNVVNLHDGRILLTSKLGQGSEFTIIFPEYKTNPPLDKE